MNNCCSLLLPAVANRIRQSSFIYYYTFDENVIPSTQVFHLLVTRRDKYALIYDFSDEVSGFCNTLKTGRGGDVVVNGRKNNLNLSKARR